MPITKKKSGTGLSMRTFVGANGETYLVFSPPSVVRQTKKAYHVFTEVQAKDAAMSVAVGRGKSFARTLTTHQMWDQLWKDAESAETSR